MTPRIVCSQFAAKLAAKQVETRGCYRQSWMEYGIPINKTTCTSTSRTAHPPTENCGVASSILALGTNTIAHPNAPIQEGLAFSVSPSCMPNAAKFIGRWVSDLQRSDRGHRYV